MHNINGRYFYVSYVVLCVSVFDKRVIAYPDHGCGVICRFNALLNAFRIMVAWVHPYRGPITVYPDHGYGEMVCFRVVAWAAGFILFSAIWVGKSLTTSIAFFHLNSKSCMAIPNGVAMTPSRLEAASLRSVVNGGQWG